MPSNASHPLQTLSHAGDLSPDCERMMALLTAIDDLIARVDGATPFEQFKDDEAFSLENRFLWCTGARFSWLDPAMADVVVAWAENKHAEGQISEMERDLLMTEAGGHFRNSIKELADKALSDPGAIKSHWLLAQIRSARKAKTLAREQASPSQSQTQESVASLEAEQAATPVVGIIKASFHADMPPDAQDKPTPPPSPSSKQSIAQPDANKTDMSPAALKQILLALAKRAKTDLVNKGDYVTLPKEAEELIQNPDLPQAALAQIMRIYMEPKTRSDAPYSPASVEGRLLEFFLGRIREERILGPKGQAVMWAYRQSLARRGPMGQDAAGDIDDGFCRLAVLTDDVAKDLIDNCLAEERYTSLNILLKHCKKLPSRLQKRIAILTSDKETLFALASRPDLTPDVARSIKKKAERLPDTKERTIILKRLQAKAAQSKQ